MYDCVGVMMHVRLCGCVCDGACTIVWVCVCDGACTIVWVCVLWCMYDCVGVCVMVHVRLC